MRILPVAFYGLLVISSALAQRWSSENAGHAPPVPGMSETSEDLSHNGSTEPPPAGGKKPKFSSSYIPAVMQALAYYTELMSYTLNEMTTVAPPFKGDGSTTASGPTTTSQATTTIKTTTTKMSRPTTVKPTTQRTTTTTQRPTTTATKRPTTRTTITPKPNQTTPPHRPGYYGPVNPPPIQASIVNDAAVANADGNIQISAGSAIQEQFFSWFFQEKPKSFQPDFVEYNLQILDPFPKGLLHDINYEGYNVPTLLDDDNVDEFLRVYDDYQMRLPYRNKRPMPLTGKKKVPPTKPYIDMLMLYDLLKREAKKLGLNKFEGYSKEVLVELVALSKMSSERFMHALLKKMLDNKDTNRSDIIARAKSMIQDLENPYTLISSTLRYIPTLKYLP